MEVTVTQQSHSNGTTPALDQALTAVDRHGISEIHMPPDRDALWEMVRAARVRDVDVTLRLEGLTADTLATHARAVCDLAVGLGVPLEFDHCGRTLQLALSSRPGLRR